MRALAYYNLAVTYGDVPLKTTPSAHDGVAVPRSPKNEVFELVRTDWEFAYENLPEKDDDGFATKWAAKAYLGNSIILWAVRVIIRLGRRRKRVLMR